MASEKSLTNRKNVLKSKLFTSKTEICAGEGGFEGVEGKSLPPKNTDEKPQKPVLPPQRHRDSLG
jgi:hypothetical protein